MKRLGLAGLLALSLAACQSTNPQDYRTDQDCLQRKAGSRILAKVAGVGLSAAGVPGGGLAKHAVSMATDPRCQAFVLTEDARKRLAKEQGAAAPAVDRKTGQVIRPTIQPATQSLVPNNVPTR